MSPGKQFKHQISRTRNDYTEPTYNSGVDRHIVVGCYAGNDFALIDWIRAVHNADVAAVHVVEVQVAA